MELGQTRLLQLCVYQAGHRAARGPGRQPERLGQRPVQETVFYAECHKDAESDDCPSIPTQREEPSGNPSSAPHAPVCAGPVLQGRLCPLVTPSHLGLSQQVQMSQSGEASASEDRPPHLLVQGSGSFCIPPKDKWGIFPHGSLQGPMPTAVLEQLCPPSTRA